MSSRTKRAARKAPQPSAEHRGAPKTRGRSPMIFTALSVLVLVTALVVLRRPTGLAVAAAVPATPTQTARVAPTPSLPALKAAAQPATPAPTSAPQPGAPALVDGVQPALSSMTPVVAVDGEVRLPAAPLADGKARFYTLVVNGKALPFFVLKSSDGVIRAAMDACDVCFPAHKGYRQEGDVMVCNSCNTRFASVKINVETGGCNPAPLSVQVQGDSVVIRSADIAAGAKYF